MTGVMTVESRTAARKARRLRGLSRALFGVAIVSALYPALTGVYTACRQERMKAGLERDFRRTERVVAAREATGATQARDEFTGWEHEDLAYWKALAEGGVFGRLRIRSLGVDVVVVKGVGKEDLKLGPGWAPWTALPGPTGNVGISGHRTTYLAPFRDIDRIQRRDEIVIESPFRVYTYRVTGQFIVKPDAMSVFGQSSRPVLTLTACHPPYTADERIVTRAELVRVTRR